MSNLLEALVSASERAANVARACCRGSSEDGALLISEKCGSDANARFDHDFKTIADVLAQECARREIGARIPELFEHVRGEECSEIEGVNITVKQTIEETAQVLGSLVPFAAALRMAEAAHSVSLSVIEGIPKDLPLFDTNDLGVWIDPIDATSEFISGARGEAVEGHGLPCVTVLIGAYLRSTGEPVAGVINQLFYNGGKGRIVWGITNGDTMLWSGSQEDTKVQANGAKTAVLMSSAEKHSTIKKFKEAGWHTTSAPGAGHKLLKVVLGEASSYVVSQATTFRWDTCAPHAILKAKGGDVIDFTAHTPLTYNDPKDLPTQAYCNKGGIIAFSSHDVLEEIKKILQ